MDEVGVTRRGFLGSILALGAAPAIVRAESIMRIAAPRILLLEQLPFVLETTQNRWLDGFITVRHEVIFGDGMRYHVDGGTASMDLIHYCRGLANAVLRDFMNDKGYTVADLRPVPTPRWS